jgi:hypothetical protein
MQQRAALCTLGSDEPADALFERARRCDHDDAATRDAQHVFHQVAHEHALISGSHPTKSGNESPEIVGDPRRLVLEIVDRRGRRGLARDRGGADRSDDEHAERDPEHRHQEARAQTARAGHDAGGGPSDSSR